MCIQTQRRQASRPKPPHARLDRASQAKKILVIKGLPSQKERVHTEIRHSDWVIRLRPDIHAKMEEKRGTLSPEQWFDKLLQAAIGNAKGGATAV